MSANFQATGFTVGANINPFEQAMRRMSDSARGASSGINRALGAIGVSLSVAVFAGWIRGAINAADETSKLAQKTGLAVNQVAGLQLAFRQAGSADSFASSIAKMSKSVVDGSKSFEAMGIKTRDANGEIKSSRQVLGEVADKFASYRDGITKTALAQEIFGKSGADLIPLLNGGAAGLAEYDAMAAKLGLTIEESTAKQAEKFNDTLDLVSQGTKGMATQIAAQLLPTLSGLADQFFTSMSSGDRLKKTADFLSTAMKGLYVSGIAVVETFKTVGTVLGGVFAAIAAAASGNFSGAMDIISGLKTDLTSSWKTALGEIDAAWNTTGSNAVENMAKLLKAGKGTAPETPSGKKAKADHAKEPTVMPTYEAALGARKLTFERENTLREFSKQQELDYWKEILTTYEVGSKDRTAIALKTGKIELDILRQSAKDKSQIKQLRAEDYKTETLGFVAELEARAAFERDMGTSTQADYLARQAGFNQLRLQAEMDFIQQKIESDKLDPNYNVVAVEQLELQKLEIKRKYKTLELNLGREAALESTSQQREMFSGIRTGFESTTASMIQGTMTLQKGLQAIWVSIQQGFAQFIAKKVTAWALGETAQTTATVTGNSIRTASDWMAATKSVAANAWSAVKNIAMKAWEVAASVYAAIAAIPYVGPFLAPVMAVAATGVVLGYAANIASASQGYDVPKGLNPMTQLHEQEMVLPAKHANVIRSLADDGNAGGRGRDVGDVFVNVNTPNADSFRRSQRQIERATQDLFRR